LQEVKKLQKDMFSMFDNLYRQCGWNPSCGGTQDRLEGFTQMGGEKFGKKGKGREKEGERSMVPKEDRWRKGELVPFEKREFGFLQPRINLSEDDKALYVHAELPGLKKKDVQIDFSDNVLTVCGEKKHDKTYSPDAQTQISERCFGTFKRSVRLPEGVDGSSIKATFEHGVLELTIPKSEEMKASKKKITLQ